LDAIKEALMQGAIYCGVPAANTAFKLTAAACQAEGINLEPAPLTARHRTAIHHTFSLPQLRVALQGADEGVPVVMSHALGMDLHMWDGLAAELAPWHPVLRFDHRGQGGSAAADQAYTVDDLVADAARVVQEWGRGPVLFIGLALRHPQLLRGLVVANSAAAFADTARQGLDARAGAVRSGGMAAVADATLERFISLDTRRARPELAEAVRGQLLRADAAGYALAAEAIRDADWLTQLHTVQCPTLVLSGEHDLGTTPAMGQQIADLVPGARHVVLPAAHLSVLECQGEFAEAVLGLLGSLG
jgi:3-oxoadipate enol-lactonase